MRHCDTLITPGWCIPVEPAGAVLEGYAVVVAEGRIADLLPAAEAREVWQPSVRIERPGHVLLPGLINAHTHAAMTLLRGVADDLPLEPWLAEGVWPIEKRWADAEMVRDGVQLAIAEMLHAGITCFADQYFFPEIVAETAVDLHMRAVVGTPVMHFPTPWANDASEYLAKGSELVHDRYAGHPLITSAFTPHSTLTLTDAEFLELRVLADQLDVPVQIHLQETRGEIVRSLEETGKRPFQRLQDLGLLNASLLAVHCVHMEAAEIAELARAGVSVAHCPKSNLKLASGIAPVAELRAAGVNVAIGTDGAASNNTLDVLDELRIATLLARGVTGDAAALTAHEALRMATLNAAHALALGDETGSIEVGKAADLTCIDLERCHSQPVYDAASQVVYTARAGQVTDAWVAGRHQLDGGRLTGVDTADLLARCDEWRQRIAGDPDPSRNLSQRRVRQ